MLGSGGCPMVSSQHLPDIAAPAAPFRLQLEHLRDLAEALPQIVWITDASGRIEFHNQRWHEFTGLLPGLDPGWEAVLHPDDLPGSMEQWQDSLRTGKPCRLECRLRRFDGQHRWFILQTYPVRDPAGSILGWFGTCTDIHSLKEAERMLREADRHKDDFLAMLSHELRNPLAPIRNSLYLLDRVEPGSRPARMAKDVIERQVGHLTRIVDDLLDVTRIARGKIKLRRERLELGELVRRTVEDHRPVFAARDVQLWATICEEPMWLTADPTRIAQIVGNLLGNAAKFTPAGGHVELALGRDGSTALLRIQDDGIGIEPRRIGRLFRPFYQAPQSLDRSQGGLGLGLALVKGLTLLHDGTVEAASAGQGLGAEFTVRLPLEAPPRRAALPTTAGPVRRRRVLLIDQDSEAANGLTVVLEELGHEVQVAYDAPSGIHAAHSFYPELVFCDVSQPDLDCGALVQAFRDDLALHGAALVALTPDARPADVERAVRAGFTLHLPKPPGAALLAQVLASA